MPPTGFQSVIPTGERLQTPALERSERGTGSVASHCTVPVPVRPGGHLAACPVSYILDFRFLLVNFASWLTN
jgi:hypothetical protein